MNVLSLRINAVKSDENFRISNQVLLEIDVEDFWPEDIKQHLRIINSSTTTEQQLREIKRFGKLITPENSKQQNVKIALKLLGIYFGEKLKHPSKSTIQSCFNQLSEQDLLVECIKSEIERRITSVDISSTSDCFHLITCLNEATQNFRPAIKAMGQQVNLIITFIKKLVEVHNRQLKLELSPAEKNVVSHHLHCSLQVVIFCIKNYFNETTIISDDVKQNLDEIGSMCVKLLDNPHVPMDTKNNCSILIVMQKSLTLDDEHLNWIKEENSSYEKRLCLIFGVINTQNAHYVDYKLLADISIILKEIFIKFTVDPSIMLSMCRSFMQLTKKLAISKLHKVSSELETITSTALSVAFLNLEHHMDSVRHLSRETLRNLADISVALADDDRLLDNIFMKIRLVSTISLKGTAIMSISPALSVSKTLEKLPNFNQQLLESISDNKVTNHALIDCYEALAQKSLTEDPFDKWYQNFTQPALNLMTSHLPQSEERLVLENLVVRLMKGEKRILEKILKNRENFDIGFVMLCLSTGKKTGRFDKQSSTSELWKGIISFKEIETAMLDADDNIRTSALMLIIETRKTVDGFTREELDCFMHFLRYNINVQSPAMRQSILGMIKNFFVRIHAVLQALKKKNENQSINFYFEFLVKFQEFCLNNLFQGANFTRRTLSLRILFYVSEAIDKYFDDQAPDIWNQMKFDVMMNVFKDSYEANKEMAIEIMKFIPQRIIRDLSSISLKQLKTMVTSIKPPDSLAASYLIELMTKFTFNFDDFDGEKSEVSPESLLMLTWCEKLLLDGLEVAEKSLIVASSTNPLYGIVLSIRHLLSKLDLKSLGVCPLWREYFKRLLIVCKRLTLVVAPVVNNSSPEGILPKEIIKDLDETTRKQWMDIIEQTTPQIILLCSWRTIKEVSLLLGDICLRIPLVNDGVGILHVEQIIMIGDHFLELLSQTKHRGAFEQCFFGFSQLCLRLWTCHEPELHKLPSEMLKQMMFSISGVDRDNNELLSMKNLCATRRSAGLPFMIQALITSELKVSTNKNFHFVMKNLIQFCQGEHLETRTHSLNILRSLFRCSDLNDAIGEYIAEGIKCAILGYGADSWIERNSSTLLFSSLMVRIFGVQKTKDSDDLSIRNKMTGRIFFLRYPELYDFFMTQLDEAASYVKAVKMNSKLHPLLLLLIRLYPSALEGSESKLELTGFIPVVTLCSGCVEMQTRILCARFIASVLSPDLLMSRIMQTIKILSESERIKANVAHGILLQILYMVKALPAVSENQEGAQNFISILDNLSSTADRFQQQLICYGTFIDIVFEVYEKCRLQKGNTEELNKHLEKCSSLKPSALFGSAIVEKKIFLIKPLKLFLDDKYCTPVESWLTKRAPEDWLLNVAAEPPWKVSGKLINSTTPLSSSQQPTSSFSSVPTKISYCVFQSAINMILLFLDFDLAVNMQEEYEISAKEISVVKNLEAFRRDDTKQQIKSDETVKRILPSLLESDDYLLKVKAFDIASSMCFVIGEWNLNSLQNFVNKASCLPEHLKKSALKYANVCANEEFLVAQLDFKFLVELSTDPSFHVKLSATDFVTSVVRNLSEIKSLDTFLYFSKTLLMLLMDDEEEIRERNTEIVMKLVGEGDRKVVPIYAQERFIEYLATQLTHIPKCDRMALILLIVVDGSNGDNSLDVNIADYRVFDKNEVNIFGETFIIKQMCLSMLKKLFNETLKADEVSEVVKATRKFADCGSEATIKCFLENL